MTNLVDQIQSLLPKHTTTGQYLVCETCEVTWRRNEPQELSPCECNVIEPDEIEAYLTRPLYTPVLLDQYTAALDFVKAHPEDTETAEFVKSLLRYDSDAKEYRVRMHIINPSGVYGEERDFSYSNAYVAQDLIPYNEDWHDIIEDEDDFDTFSNEYANRESDSSLYRYNDIEPDVVTGVTERWSNSRVRFPYDNANHLPTQPGRTFTLTPYYKQRERLDWNTPEVRSALMFEELNGFASELIINPEITHKKHLNVFNGYFGTKDRKFHIGLLTFDNDEVNKILTVKCGHGQCHYRKNPLVLDYSTCSLSDLEQIAHAIIRHGNNHGPDWITKRQDFTYIHAMNCDAKHDTHSTIQCNANVTPAISAASLDGSLDNVIDFLISHRKHCRNIECRCTHYYHLLCSTQDWKVTA